MRISKYEQPILGQVWAWTFDDPEDAVELILLTRIKKDMYFGILLYSYENENLIGTEVCADYVVDFASSHRWSRVS